MMYAAAIATDIWNRLADLGDDPDIIAENLAAAGITGHRNEAAACPLYHYLRAEIPPVRCVGDVEIAYDAGGPLPEFTNIPPVAGEFVRRFDEGGYPELVAS